MTAMAQLLKKIQKPPLKVVKPATSQAALALINRLETARWLRHCEDGLMKSLRYLKDEIRVIDHLPKCTYCKMELMIDVERYCGTHIAWYVNLEDNGYLERRFKDCPKIADYPIDNYWDQVKRYQKTGSTEGGPDTLKFIMARARWAYKIIGKQIHVVRKMLKLVRAWDFSDETMRSFLRWENRLYLAEAMIFQEDD